MNVKFSSSGLRLAAESVISARKPALRVGKRAEIDGGSELNSGDVSAVDADV
jgi:hypothetical protein